MTRLDVNANWHPTSMLLSPHPIVSSPLGFML